MNREIRYNYHSKVVAVWIVKATEGMPDGKLIAFFEKTFLQLFRRTQVSVSEVTLFAILDRVLYNSTEKYPLLGIIQLNDSVLKFSDYGKVEKNFSAAEIKEAFQSLITEFLFIIGNLTGEQLTPYLHAEFNLITKDVLHLKPAKKETL